MLKISKIRIKDILYFIFLVDAMLLPIYHIGDIPYKLSYLACSFVIIKKIVDIFLQRKAKIEKDVFILCLIILFMLIGWINYVRIGNPVNFSVTFRQIIIILLGIGAYYLAIKFEFKKIYFFFPILCCSLNLLLILLWDFSWMKEFYLVEYRSLSSMLIRNVGIWGNPNSSALGANLIFIFSLLGVKQFHKTSKEFSSLKVIFLLTLPTFINILLSLSRSGLVCFLLINMIYYFSKAYSRGLIKRLITVAILIFCLLSIFLFFPEISLLYDAKNISLIRIIDTELGIKGRVNIYGMGFNRITQAPILGSGADISSIEPYDERRFHNDYIILWSIGGILALLLYLLFIYRVIKIEPIFLPPFLFPGLTNQFLWNILAFSIICFLYSWAKKMNEAKSK